MPLDTNLASNFSQISSGNTHTCALTKSGGRVKCWGVGSSGQLGSNGTSNQTKPINVHKSSSDSTSLIGVTSLSSGGSHTCALTDRGGVKCWGYNGNGELGNKSTSNQKAPVDVHTSSSDSTSLSGVASISAGDAHTCALTSGGGVKCWGSGNSGQLGNGSTNNATTPVAVTGLTTGVTAISAGGSHTCALTTSGGVKCWGSNSNGQLGNSTTTNSTTPVDVTGLASGVKAVNVGISHTCALTTGGGVKCWGYGDSGRLGNGTTTDSNAPVNVTGLTSGVSAISGYNHTCALTTGGGVKCWGPNNDGQLGNGTTTDSNAPVNVTGLTSGISQVSAGGKHTCALSTNGSTKCWGTNSYGELGRVKKANKVVPMPIFVGTTSTPTFVLANRSSGEVVSVYSDSTCSTSKGTGTIGSNNTAVKIILSSLGDSGTYSLYYKIVADGFQPLCAGPIKYTF